jgi:phosphoribosylaminoimidazolecarboxamide formyltransferase / IMP cyclohydrolase
MPRALLAPYDKNGLPELARGLAGLGWELVATGNTERVLREAGLPVTSVSEVTGFPEMLDGRVKTLHPAVHGGLLARRASADHMRQLAEHGISGIDLVACNLYPFEATIGREGVSLEEALENIDIGGPAMLRAAAKNFPDVVVLCDPADYDGALSALKTAGPSLEERRRLAARAFQHVALYDTLVAGYLRGEVGGKTWPEELTLALRRKAGLRYGENPHQGAALYEEAGQSAAGGIVGAKQLHGMEMSYNNYMDADAAWRAVQDFAGPTIAIIKHNTPCGLASNEDLLRAYDLAFTADPISAFGGIVAVNRPVDGYLARAIRASVSPSSGQRMRYDIIAAPSFTEKALEALTRARDLRVLEVPGGDGVTLDVRRVGGGFLVQDPDRKPDPSDEGLQMRVVTRRTPTDEEVRDLKFAWRACKHVKSNAVVLAKDNAMVGMGAGQPNRVTSVRLAAERAGERARGSVLATDAYFPFFDGVAAAAAAGVTAVISPGGSVRDDEVIAIADAAGMAMVFTGERHFRH